MPQIRLPRPKRVPSVSALGTTPYISVIPVAFIVETCMNRCSNNSDVTSTFRIVTVTNTIALPIAFRKLRGQIGSLTLHNPPAYSITT